MARYEVTDVADNDVFEIGPYLGARSTRAAEQFVADLVAAYESLAEFPRMGRSREDIKDGLRSFAVGRYLIFYREIQDGVRILRVLHGARDVESELE